MKKEEVMSSGSPIPRDRPQWPCQCCGRHHQLWRRAAECRWEDAAWVAGQGPWASVARCLRATTVMLFPTLEEAYEAKQAIDHTGCGGMCAGRHLVVHVEDD